MVSISLQRLHNFMEKSNILANYSREINYDALCAERIRSARLLQTEHWRSYLDLFAECQVLAKAPCRTEFSHSVVTVGAECELSEDGKRKLHSAIQKLIPWRKGPFNLFGIEIDAEWRSDLKWARIAPHLERARGARIADIGCSNGYYMFRALALEPEIVLGLDPAERNYYSFELVNSFVRDRRLAFELLGVEHMWLFPHFFDIVLCMGVLYHRKNPLGDLALIRDSLRPGGQVIVESQAIPGEESLALFPADRYCKAPNVYFLPTANCLVSWLKRVGFVDVEIISTDVTSTYEQRKTLFAPYESLSDFLDPNDENLTVEGYKRPLRVAVKARTRKQ